jgi:hypothetical protein
LDNRPSSPPSFTAQVDDPWAIRDIDRRAGWLRVAIGRCQLRCDQVNAGVQHADDSLAVSFVRELHQTAWRRSDIGQPLAASRIVRVVPEAESVGVDLAVLCACKRDLSRRVLAKERAA